MFIINFEKLKRGQEIRGGITPIRILFTLLYFYLRKYKPVIYRAEPNHRVVEKGWFVRKGYGGRSGEPLVRLNWGNRYSSFHAYNRKGMPRMAQTKYVPFKSGIMQTKV